MVADGVSTAGKDILHINMKRHFKISPVTDSESCFIGLSGTVKAINTIKDAPILHGKKDVTYEYLVNNVVGEMAKMEKRMGCLVQDRDKETCFDFSMLLMTPTKLFEFNSYGAVVEHEKIACIGSGDPLLYMAYHMLKDKIEDPKELAIECMKQAINRSTELGYPIVIASNEGDYEIIKDENSEIERIE